MKRATLSWVTTTPLGVPVEPDVNRMYAGSPGEVAASIGASDIARASSSTKRTPDGACPPSQPSGRVRIQGLVSDRSASNGRAAVVARRQQGSTAASMAAARGAGLPRSIGTYTPPAFRTASTETIAAGD